MLKITVELLPFGDEKRKRHLGTAKIANDGTGDSKTGNYKVSFSKWGQPNRIWKAGEVKDFPRLIRGPWDLLYLALKEVVGDRNE